ncbi:MAG: peptidylprolyl isomerase [Anaerolineae bacterium]|nr:peptidylprolyl isomerase [Anaerolineae bacterium]
MKQKGILTGIMVMGILSACTIPGIDATPPPTANSTAAISTALPAPTATPEPVAALVNDVPIPLAAYERQVARYEADMAASGQDPSLSEEQAVQDRAWVLEIMIDQVLIEQAGIQAGITVSDADVDAAIASLKTDIGQEAFDAWLANEGFTLEEMREKLRSEMVTTQMVNKIAETVPTHGEHILARHILVNTQEEAQQLLGRLQAGEDFAELARTYSQDPSTRDTGGDLGYFPQGVLISPEVEAAAFALQPGQIGPVVQSAMGYHVIQVVERVPDMEITSDNVYLLRDKAVREWVAGLRASANIQRFVAATP